MIIELSSVSFTKSTMRWRKPLSAARHCDIYTALTGTGVSTCTIAGAVTVATVSIGAATYWTFAREGQTVAQIARTPTKPIAGTKKTSPRERGLRDIFTF